MLGQPPEPALSAVEGAIRPSKTRRRHEGAAGVARPDPICSPAVKPNVIAECIGAVEDFAGVFLGRSIGDDQFDSFVSRKIANDFRVDPRDRFKLSRPVVAIVRPGQPGSLVRLPLGRHANRVLGSS